MGKIGSHAVVIGASMAGLLAARALADAYERVTIVERDRLPATGEGRKAVPQGRHVHILLPAGQAAMESLLPGLGEELVAAGANRFGPDQLRFEVAGHLITRDMDGELDAPLVSASRPLTEGHVRRRVLAVPGVEAVERANAVGLTTDERGERVTGIRVVHRDGDGDEERLGADVVLAAGGRAG